MESNILQLSENEQARAIQTRWEDSSTLAQVIQTTYKNNKKQWVNHPDWLDRVPKTKSRARDNRVFLATESVINSLTGRPSKPNTIPANSTDDSMAIADDLQEFVLAKYRDLGMKGKMRRSLRHLFLSRFMCLKIVWDPVVDDFDTIVRDPTKIRVSKKASSMFDTGFVIEQVTDTPLTKLLKLFPKKEEEILKKAGVDKKRALIENTHIEYREAWINGCVLWEFRGKILDAQPHPYWDWDGLRMTGGEQRTLEKLNGRRRRGMSNAIKSRQEDRAGDDKEVAYRSYLYNHFDNPIPPYVFGTVLSLSDSPVGETSLIEQVIPLQYELDKRKRQISDNADLVNGIIKVDTDLVTISKAEAQTLATNPKGIWYGSGVRFGVERVMGNALPEFVFKEMNHSRDEIDNIFGTQPTFRGEGGGNETATGRAILREQSFSRLDELIDLVDTIHHQIYAWWYQMIKVRYTEEHLVKPIGATNAREVIGLTQDDLQEGIELNIVPGQILPEDRLYQAERAKEEFKEGLLDPLSYFEETGRDNPMKLAKRLVMFQSNPFSIITLDPEDVQKLSDAQSQLQFIQGGVANVDQTGGGNQNTQVIQQLTQKAKEIADSDLPKEQKQQAIAKVREQLTRLQQAKSK